MKRNGKGKLREMPQPDPGPLIVRVGGQTLRVDVEIEEITGRKAEVRELPRRSNPDGTSGDDGVS